MRERDKVRQLPRGRHRLSRDQVVASQRGRMLAAMAEAVAQRGYARTTVADVLSRARVSRETFYEQFADKEDCFLAAYDFAVEALLEGITDAVAEATDPFARFEAALAAYLEEMAREGTLARVFLIEVYGAGPRAVERRVEVLERFVDAFAEILSPYGADRFECEALVAAVSSLVTTRVASGRLDELPALRAPLLELAGRLLSLAATGDEAGAGARQRLSRAR